MYINTMSIKERQKHEIYPGSVNLSDYMREIAEEISETFGGNANNQISISNGIQIALLRWKDQMSTDNVQDMYPKITFKLSNDHEN